MFTSLEYSLFNIIIVSTTHFRFEINLSDKRGQKENYVKCLCSNQNMKILKYNIKNKYIYFYN